MTSAVERYLQRRYLAADMITDHELGLVEAHQSHPFFTKFLRSNRLRWFAPVSIALDSEILAVMSVHCSLNKEDFTADERATLFRLSRHADKSLRLGLRLMESETRSQGLSDLLARLNMGCSCHA